MKKGLIVGIFALFFVSCGNKEMSDNSKDEVPVGVLVDGFRVYENSAPLNIENIALNGHLLTLQVSYSGGCEKHEFQLVGSTMLMKSLPPKRPILLYHDNNGDSCRELVKDTLTFDIRAFAYSNGEVHLLLEGWENPIPYNNTLEE